MSSWYDDLIGVAVTSRDRYLLMRICLKLLFLIRSITLPQRRRFPSKRRASAAPWRRGATQLPPYRTRLHGRRSTVSVHRSSRRFSGRQTRTRGTTKRIIYRRSADFEIVSRAAFAAAAAVEERCTCIISIRFRVITDGNWSAAVATFYLLAGTRRSLRPARGPRRRRH